jgi:hypothetical protein
VTTERVSTVAELDSLPDESVVLSGSQVAWQREGYRWYEASSFPLSVTSEALFDEHSDGDPMTVLYTPEES